MTLKMALQQFVCRFTLLTLLLCSGCHPSVVTDNSTDVEDVTPGTSPWLVYFYPYFRCVGSLITDQWVLTDNNCLSDSINNILAYVGLKNRSEGYSNAMQVKFDTKICNPANEQICLLKLSSPVNLTDDIQTISLASSMSTIYNSTSTWASLIVLSGKFGILRTMKEIKASIAECSCDEILTELVCATVIFGNFSQHQVTHGSPLLVREHSQWLIAGVSTNSIYQCGATAFPSSVGYQYWVYEVIGRESTIVNPTGMGTQSYKTTTPTTTIGMTTFTPATTDGSIFSGGNNLIHFTHFFSLSALVLFLHILVGDSEI